MADRYLTHKNNLLSLNGKLIKVDFGQTVNKIPETKTVTPTTTQQTVTPSDNDHELTKVTVKAIETEDIIMTQNGTYNASGNKYIESVTVNVNQSDLEVEYDQSTGTLILNYDGNSIKSNPLVVENANEMPNYLTSDYVGIIIHYIGETTSEYTQNEYYVINEVME